MASQRRSDEGGVPLPLHYPWLVRPALGISLLHRRRCARRGPAGERSREAAKPESPAESACRFGPLGRMTMRTVACRGAESAFQNALGRTSSMAVNATFIRLSGLINVFPLPNGNRPPPVGLQRPAGRAATRATKRLANT